MAEANIRLSRDEILMLRSLAEGRPVHLASTHRLRLELLGVLNDGANGLVLTPLGRRCAQQRGPEDEPPPTPVPLPRDRLGRRKANRRLSPF